MLDTYFKKKAEHNNSSIFKATLFNINNNSEKEQLLGLLNLNQNIEIYDEIENQLIELIKIKHPSQKDFSDESIQNLIQQHLNGIQLQNYGVWVYYPWSKRLVHILDEQEFIYVRTNRNRNKITEEEQNILSNKKVGIVGLSVGQSIALTIASERCCGEIRLADFDTLELSNLNRIRTPLHNLGLNKAVSVAREIAEIDPFIKIIVYERGIYKENMADFFIKESTLDILIDECDSIDMKLALRIQSKSLKIPVLMDTSDRGMVDIERFDLEPTRPILHGLIDSDIDVEKYNQYSDNEKMNLIFKIIEIENTSKRLKESMIEIGKSIRTWPQLASSVIIGGGVITDLCRRIFLNHHSSSGRYYIDIEELIK